MSASIPSAKPARADARRNYEALLAAGRNVFMRDGTDAPMDDVAKEAGVGRATLYRHFPSREHLFVAIMQDRVDLLDTQARELLGAPDVWEALVQWLLRYDRSATEYRGMSTRVGDGLADDGSPMASACAPMKASFARLFARAQDEGAVRGDVTAVLLLALISALPKHAEHDASADAYLDIVLRGLRP
ncbi:MULTISPECIES: TetR/AcrR family transcriptional regulator [unclassified Streptomyces]|uniref:TetR/AcrR family transcriptional regulator n=1 Tax=unclassified Streptomyces TaxID=2593676 RepID=UPI002DDBB3BF|nr:TetR/AcrR family transcriptional regulator [Streptomyces sp. NBC_01445]WSE02316.1 TetR/AcrR family transcriptional regulator [Streptomyces sp. NBC_01445]